MWPWEAQRHLALERFFEPIPGLSAHFIATRLMAHEIAKLILEHAESNGERAAAIRTALSLGMPLHQIEEYLDWLDQVRPPKPSDEKQDPSL